MRRLSPAALPRALLLPLNLRKPGVEDRPIGHPPEVFEAEGAGPCRQPLRGAERLDAVATPTGVEDRLILCTGGTQSPVHIHRAVRDALARRAPEGDGAFAPLDAPGERVQPQEGLHIAQGVLVERLVRG